MAQIIVKFGGSNLKSPADIERSARVAAAYQTPLVVVVSAFSGVTDALIRGIDEAILSEKAPDTLCSDLKEIHETALKLHIESEAERNSVRAVLQERLEQLKKLLVGIHYIGAVPDFTRDQIVSTGERLSAPIVAAVLRKEGLPAREILPETMGLLTDGAFGNAAADLTACAQRLPSILNPDITPVIPGFYGLTREGKIAIFGRGGSDYTAAVIARSIHAESLDLWKDVDGFLSGDPRIIPDSRTIPFVSYEEAAELSYFGAKVLHPRTVEPLEQDQIPIRVMNVEQFDGNIKPYTLVGPAKQGKPSLKSVAATEDIGIVRLEGPGVGSRPGILARATAGLDAAGINISSVITSQTSINLLFRKKDLSRALAVLRSESVPSVVAVEHFEDIAIIAAVGDGLRHTPGLASQVFGALAEGGINVLLTQAGASPVAMYVIVKKEDKARALRAIHKTIHRG
ncbi:aspartate kinase [Gracilinema caldarium]|uniref:aspartate kinase n=1 Tax=Gracilinema caldarium TaxID=215591 RepID=UPI0026EAC385|nr:aspartate kinase [Gracilinema caldarium]